MSVYVIDSALLTVHNVSNILIYAIDSALLTVNNASNILGRGEYGHLFRIVAHCVGHLSLLNGRVYLCTKTSNIMKQMNVPLIRLCLVLWSYAYSARILRVQLPLC
jgi:hypothetical protein